MKRVTVPALDGMDTPTMYKHWNLRHMPMAGTTSFHPSPDEDSATRALRAYHRHVHAVDGIKDHDHKEES